jgi:c(7)-type cytochrome triheme protein
MTSTRASLFRNLLSLAGFGLCALSLPAGLFLLLADFFAPKTHPYAGIITYMIVPMVFALGLGLAFCGALWEAWRRRRGLGHISLPRLDLNEARDRRIVLTIAIVAVGLSVLGAVGSYRAYEFTDSVTFCGEVCHKVMAPEYTAYQESPHARVTCAECHVGPGAGWFVKSKLSGMYQVYAVLRNKYPRPIPTPIENLRPAQETCEQCHWPQKFFGAQLSTRVHFEADEGNTRVETVMLVKTGGGDPIHGPSQGIHWHMNISNKVAYVELDPRRQIIPWVRVEHADGRATEYLSRETPISAEALAAAPRRRMDCMDCHNRPTHHFLSPDRAMNQALLRGRIDATLPFIKRQGVEVLAQNYASFDEADRRIRESLTAFYAERYPAVAKSRQPAIEAAIKEIQRIYRTNNFPEMGVTWRAYPDNIGHKEFPGCFRCHEGKHISAEGQVLSRDCAICHTFLVKAKDGQTMIPAKAEPAFAHPWKLGGRHAEIRCNQCHSGGIPLVASCAGCHAREPKVHAALGCASCHLKEQLVKPLAQCTACHLQRVGLHAGTLHRTLACTNCHHPHEWKVTTRDTCERCHTDRREHNAGADCWACHRFEQPGLVAAAAAAGAAPTGSPRKLTPEGGGDLLLQGAAGSIGPVTFQHKSHVPRGLGCTECHTRLFPLARSKGHYTMASMAAGQNCGACHNGTKAFAAMDSTRCMTCHRPPGAPPPASSPPPPRKAETVGPEARKAGAKKIEAKAPAKAPAQVGGGDIAYSGAAGSPAPVVFSHARHAARNPNCADCHPKAFSMPKGTAKFTMASMGAGQNCGTCHDGKTAFAAMDAARCTTCHKAP